MLIACSSCGKRVSDRAPVCPFCQAARAAESLPSMLPGGAGVSGVAPSALAPPAAQPSLVAPAAEARVLEPAPLAPARPLPFQVGDFVGDALQIMALLGEGGFGVVYRAISHSSKMVYALKTIRDELLRDEAARAMFRKEAQIWVDLQAHPHLVQLHFVDEVNQRLFLAMEYVAPDRHGLNSLEAYLKRRPPDLPRALRWAIQFCHGMEYAYTRGVRCHRDIKPANILLADGVVKISDFGIAGLAGTPDAAGDVFGTPTHMPPEQFVSAAACDERSDVYAFGVVLHQMAQGGALPFVPPLLAPGPDLGARLWLALRQLHAQAPLPRLDSPLGPVVARCLAKLQGQRYPGFAALRAELEALLGQATGESVAVPEQRGAQAFELSNRGLSLAQLGRFDEALAHYGQALAAAVDGPQAARIRNNRGNLLRKLGRAAEAAEDLRQAIELDPAYAAPRVNQGLLLIEAERMGEAVACLRQALELDAADSVAWQSLGVALSRVGRTEEALRCHEKAIELDPKDADSWFSKGLTLDRLGRKAEALPCLERAVALDPRHVKAWAARGVVLGDLGRRPEALAAFDEALRLDPRDPQAWYNRGNVCVQAGDFAAALHGFTRATELAPEFALGWNNRGLAAMQLGRQDEAASSLEEFLRRGGWQDPGQNERVRALAGQLRSGAEVRLGGPASITPADESGQGAAEKAAAEARGAALPAVVVAAAPPAAPRTAPERVVPRRRIRELNDRGDERFQRKQYAEALELFEQALAIDPHNVTALNNKANCLFFLGRREEALAMHEAVLERAPLMLGSWLNKGVMEKILGREAEALRTLQDTQQLGDANDRFVRSARAEAEPLAQRGVRPGPRTTLGQIAFGYAAAAARRMDEALRCFEQAIALAPRQASPWYWKAQALLEAGRLEECLPAYDQALRRSLKDARPWHGKGLALARLRRFEEAVGCFEEAVEANPHDVASWSDRGKSLGVLGRYEESIESLQRAIALDPEAPAPWLNKALAEDELGREADALASYSGFLAVAQAVGDARPLAPQVNQARRRVAALEVRVGRAAPVAPPPAPVAPAEQPVAAAAPSAAPVAPGPAPSPAVAAEALKRGQILLNQGKVAPALQAFDLALAGIDAPAAAWLGRGECLLRLERPAEAVEALERAVEGEPALPRAWHLRGQALEGAGRIDDALRSFDRAAELDSKNPSHWVARGQALLRLGRLEEALSSFEIALQVDPRAPLAKFHQAEVVDRMGDAAAAVRSFQQFLALAPAHLTAHVQHARQRLQELRGQ